MEDSGELEAIVAKVISENPDVVERIQGGNAKAMGALVGPIMRETKGRADGGEVNRLLRSALGLCGPTPDRLCTRDAALRPASWTSSATWTRLSTSSLTSSRETCALTVATLMCSSAAISALAPPRPTAQRDLALAGARAPPAGPAPARGARRPRPPRARSAAGSTVGESIALARVDVLDRAHDLRRRRVLEQEARRRPPAARAGRARRRRTSSARSRPGETAGRAPAASPRSRRRPACGCPSARRRAGGGRPRPAPRARPRPRRRPRPAAPAEHHPQPGAHERVVVDQQDADHVRPGEGRAQDEVAARVRAVLERAADQLDALGEPDQPAPARLGPAARDAPSGG